MTGRTPIDRDPIRAPAAQPALFYRDGRALSPAERGVKPAAIQPGGHDALPETRFAPLLQAVPRASDMLPAVAAILVSVAAAVAFKMMVGGLIFADFLAFAIAKNR